MSNGIPTVYANIRFRSRLEATWAAFFDLCSWDWKYEALDLDRYIPDFFLLTKTGPLLVEVKPAVRFEDFVPAHAEKILEAGWTGNAMMVGSGLILDKRDEWSFGLIRRPLERDPGDWTFAWPTTCENCHIGMVDLWEKPDPFAGEYQPWPCLICGSDLGSHAGNASRRAIDLWHRAQNATQWRPGR